MNKALQESQLWISAFKKKIINYFQISLFGFV